MPEPVRTEDFAAGPRSFTDTAGRTWPVTITVTDLKRVRQLTGIELGKLTLQGLAELVADPATFADVLYVLVKDEADRLGVSDVSFGRALSGDVMEAAALSFWRAWADFCPSQTRQVVLGLAARAMRTRDEVVTAALAVLADTTSNGPLTNLPVPPESTPVPGPSAS